MRNKTEVSEGNVRIVPQDDGAAFDLLGSRLLTKVDCDDVDGAFCLVQLDVPSNAVTPVHHHPFPEIFFALSGSAEFGWLENGKEKWIAVKAGETVIVPSNAPHGFRNLASTVARMLVVVTRRHQEFFQTAGRSADLQQPASPATPEELERVVRIAEKYQMLVD